MSCKFSRARGEEKSEYCQQMENEHLFLSEEQIAISEFEFSRCTRRLHERSMEATYNFNRFVRLQTARFSRTREFR